MIVTERCSDARDSTKKDFDYVVFFGTVVILLVVYAVFYIVRDTALVMERVFQNISDPEIKAIRMMVAFIRLVAQDAVKPFNITY